MRTEQLIEKLHAAQRGDDIQRLIEQLQKRAHDERQAVLAAFLTYMREGRIAHWRSFIVASALELLDVGESQHADTFRAGMRDETTAYWSLAGLAKCLQAASYPELVAFALDERQVVEARGHAVQLLAGLSQQTFTRGLASDPGEWQAEELPLSSLVDWRAVGYPAGAGFEVPAPSPELSEPQSEIDRLAAKLERKLQRYRKQHQDPANPSNWLLPAHPSDLEAVQARWRLPERYVEFLTKFSPLGVAVFSTFRFAEGLCLFGAGELLVGQHGYSYNPLTSQALLGWNDEHVVIAAHAGDPYVLDLAATRAGDCPVLTAEHGQGGWHFRRFTATFSAFLGKLA